MLFVLKMRPSKKSRWQEDTKGPDWEFTDGISDEHIKAKGSDGSTKDFAPGLWDAYHIPPSSSHIFPTKSLLLKAILHQKSISDSEWEKEVDGYCKMFKNWRLEIEESEEDLVGMPPHCREVLKSTNKLPSCNCSEQVTCECCVNNSLKNMAFVPSSRSPAFFQKCVDFFDLPDKRLGEDIKMGMPMREVDTRNWRQQNFSDKEWAAKTEAWGLKAELGHVHYPLKPMRVKEADLPKYSAMSKAMENNANRGRYVFRDEEEFAQRWTSSEKDDNFFLVRINPIDQSCMRDDGSWKDKFRQIWDGRGPNCKFYSRDGPCEKITILGREVLHELIMLAVARNPERQAQMPFLQRKKDAYADSLVELEKKKEYKEKSEVYWTYREGFSEQLKKAANITFPLPAGSMEELLVAVVAVNDAIVAENRELGEITVVDDFGNHLTLLTRDYTEAYYQIPVSDPELNWFVFFQVDVDDVKTETDGSFSYGGSFKFGVSRVLNMGAVPAIIGFLRISEWCQRTLWSCNCPNIMYIDDDILLTSPGRKKATAKLIDSLNCFSGMEASVKPEARQDSSDGTVKLLGLNYTEWDGGFLCSCPASKEAKAERKFGDIQDSTNLVTNPKFLADVTAVKRLQVKELHKATGLYGHIQDSKPDQLGRVITKQIYWWTVEENFVKANRNHKLLKALYKSCAVAKEMVKIGTPNLLNKSRADLEKVLVFSDAAGIEDEEPQISALILGAGCKPLWFEKAIRFDNTDLDQDSKEDLELYNRVAKNIQFWEMVVCMEVSAALGDKLDNKWVRFMIDNAGGMYNFISPSSSDSPTYTNAAFLWRINLTARGVIPSLGYIASPRNIGDLWTRRAKTTSEVKKLEKVCSRIGDGVIRIKEILKVTIPKMVEKLIAMDEEYRMRFKLPMRSVVANGSIDLESVIDPLEDYLDADQYYEEL